MWKFIRAQARAHNVFDEAVAHQGANVRFWIRIQWIRLARTRLLLPWFNSVVQTTPRQSHLKMEVRQVIYACIHSEQ